MTNNQNNNVKRNAFDYLAGALIVGGGIYALGKGLQSLMGGSDEPKCHPDNAHKSRIVLESASNVEVITTVSACRAAVRKLRRFVVYHNNYLFFSNIYE